MNSMELGVFVGTIFITSTAGGGGGAGFSFAQPQSHMPEIAANSTATRRSFANEFRLAGLADNSNMNFMLGPPLMH
jgi:hypothetical protein